MNNGLGYLFQWAIRLVGFHYVFNFNADYSSAQILPTVKLPIFGDVSLPSKLLSFTMVLQHPPAELCPPKEGASKKDVSKCAIWDRVSTGFLSPLFGSYGEVHYYVHRIVDKDGKPVQPFFDKFLEFSAARSKPNELMARILGVSLGQTRIEKATSFVCIRPGSNGTRTGINKSAEL